MLVRDATSDAQHPACYGVEAVMANVQQVLLKSLKKSAR